jgi:hypothetical protein
MVCAGDATPDPNLLERMAANQEFRGPDSTRFARRPARVFALQFCDAVLRPNPRNNHAHWMDPCGCSTCVSMGAKRRRILSTYSSETVSELQDIRYRVSGKIRC